MIPLSILDLSVVTTGTKPLIVHFTSQAAGGTGIYDFSWDFGDGTSGNGFDIIHTYTKAGTFTATVTVTSGDQKKTCSKTITVS